MKRYWYDGSLSSRGQMAANVEKAYTSLRAQRERCNNKNSKKYEKYGAVGVRVQYSTREYIGWYLEHYRSKKWTDPTVGRIDHSADYCFANIEMQERSDNSKERCRRDPKSLVAASARKKKPLVALKNGRVVKRFDSLNEASAFYKKTPGAISQICSGINKQSKDGIVFRYLGDG